MKPTRPTQSRLEQMQARERFLLRQIKRAKLMEDGQKTEFWTEIKAMVKGKLGAIEAKLDEYESLTADQRTSFLEARKQLKYFAAAPEDFSGSHGQFVNELDKLRQEIGQYKARLKKYE